MIGLIFKGVTPPDSQSVLIIRRLNHQPVAIGKSVAATASDDGNSAFGREILTSLAAEKSIVK